MFSNLFNFGFQRSALQAVGWFLFFLLIGALLSGLAGGLAYSLGYLPQGDFSTGFKGGAQIGRIVMPAFCIFVGILLFFSKPITPLSVVVTLLAFLASFLAGWLGAGIFLAFLTTRPSRA
jgi:hypothetical protein